MSGVIKGVEGIGFKVEGILSILYAELFRVFYPIPYTLDLLPFSYHWIKFESHAMGNLHQFGEEPTLWNLN